MGRLEATLVGQRALWTALEKVAREINPDAPKYKAVFENIPGLDPDSDDFLERRQPWITAITDVALIHGLTGAAYGGIVAEIAVEQGLATKDTKGRIPGDVFYGLFSKGQALNNILHATLYNTGKSHALGAQRR